MLFTPVCCCDKKKWREKKRREEKKKHNRTGFFQKSGEKKAPNSTRNSVLVKLKQLIDMTHQQTTLREYYEKKADHHAYCI